VAVTSVNPAGRLAIHQARKQTNTSVDRQRVEGTYSRLMGLVALA
jgi:hypothetical protein